MLGKPKLVTTLDTRLAERHPLIQVLLGPRQVGKTTSAKTVYDRFSGSKHFVSADGPTPPDFDWLRTHWLRARALPPPTVRPRINPNTSQYE